MEKFEINVLGCGSATPTLQHLPSSQVLNIREKLFMIDCGEGAQLQFRKMKLKFSRLNHIFISHLHGDHCFGLIGLISTLALLGRTGDLTISSPVGLEELLKPQLDFFCKDIPFEVIFQTFNTTESELIYEDRSITVHTIPLKHRIPCAGFLFREKPGEANIISEKIKFYNIPIKEITKIKQGADFVTPEGVLIPHDKLTRPAQPARAYAYCSDTAYNESIIPLLTNVDLLYHEATFGEDHVNRAKMTGHSTATQAAQIAKLAKVKELMIGHFSSRYSDNDVLRKEAVKVFTETILANEGLCKKL